MASKFGQLLDEARDLMCLINEIKDEIKRGKREAFDEPDADHATQKKPKSNEKGEGGPEKAKEPLAEAGDEAVSPAMSTDERGSETRWSIHGADAGSQSDEDPPTPRTPPTP